ncbi:hypothetical protein CHARACLAT_004155 [Characodon lateralis]|uniref:Uncharacterized protein n=1 Tax=Characodon lateralis TaxID=208331 RepID=A0ABU7EQY2_9TELE|nr:hypothetical protein [Characodon lateralis]
MPKNKIYLGAVHFRLYLFWCFSHHFKPRLQAIARQLSPETSPQSSTKAPASSAIICLLALQPTSFRSQAFINFPLSETQRLHYLINTRTLTISTNHPTLTNSVSHSV